MKKYLTEFIGTFFLVITFILSVNHPGIAPMAPFAIAGIYVAMIYAGSAVSGGFYNPAVTIAFLMRRRIDRTDALYYIIVQLIASVLAAAIGAYLHDCSVGPEIVSRVNEQAVCAVLGEFLGTFALVYVMLTGTAQRSMEPNAQQAIAVGFTVLAITFGLGGLSGTAFNPAIVVGGSVAGMFEWSDLLVYLIGSMLGAAAAATVVQLIQEGTE